MKRIYSNYSGDDYGMVCKLAAELGFSLSSFQHYCVMLYADSRGNTTPINNLMSEMFSNLQKIEVGKTFIVSALLPDMWSTLMRSEKMTLAKQLAIRVRNDPSFSTYKTAKGKTTVYIKNIKLIEWNINKRSTNTPCKEYVCSRILEQNADIICLTEYLSDELIKSSLKEMYWIEESNCSQGNQILIAVKKSFVKKEPTVVRNNDEPECYNLLHLEVENNLHTFSVVGIRMLTGEGENAMNAEKQTAPLKDYLKKLKEPFICVGDFNIREYRMKHWFSDYKIHKIQPSDLRLEEASYLFTNDDKKHKEFDNAGALDHIISDKTFEVSSRYNWDFLKDDKKYPTIEELRKGHDWTISPGYPDHGMLIAEIEFTNTSKNKINNHEEYLESDEYPINKDKYPNSCE